MLKTVFAGLLAILACVTLAARDAAAEGDAIAWGVAIGEPPLAQWSTPLLASPDLSAPEAAPIASGELVEILGAMQGWVYARTETGTLGYMPQAQLIVFTPGLPELATLDASQARLIRGAIANRRGYCFAEPDLAALFDNGDCTAGPVALSANEQALAGGLDVVIASQAASDTAAASALSKSQHDTTMEILKSMGGRQCLSYEDPAYDTCYR